MKKYIAVLSIALLAVVGLTGCVTQNKQVMTTQTIFGFQLAANPNTGITGVIPQVQFGLIRSHYASNPTSTNQINAAPMTSAVQANLGMLNQSATENESFGR